MPIASRTEPFVEPRPWTDPGDLGDFDAVLPLVACSGGYVLIEFNAGADLDTALIEREHLGGTCVNHG